MFVALMPSAVLASGAKCKSQMNGVPLAWLVQPAPSTLSARIRHTYPDAHPMGNQPRILRHNELEKQEQQPSTKPGA